MRNQPLRSLVTIATGAIAAVALSLGSAVLPATAAVASTETAASASQNLVAAPAGAGSDCTSTAPCLLATALKVATPGAAITMLPGEYGAQILRGMVGGTAAQPITVTASAGVTMTRLETHVPHVSWSGQHITVVLYVHPLAVGTSVERAHLDGAGSFIRSTDVSIRDSVFENGTSIDGVQIKDSRRVTFADNIVRNYSSVPGSSVHVDCVQVFDSHDVTIERNSLMNCSNSAIILSNGNGYGSSGIHILSNFIQGCVVAFEGCVGGSSLDARELAFVDTVIRNNTIASGPTRVSATDGLVFDRNIVEYFFGCDAPMTNTIVVASRYASCLWQLGVNGNRSNSVTFADVASGDLRLVTASDAQLAPVGTSPAEFDIDGQPLKDTIAGAHSPLNIPLNVSTSGTGTACTAIQPCRVASAIAMAYPGAVIELAAGNYAGASVTGTGGTANQPITVRPAAGASVTFGKVTTAVPHVRWQALSFTAGFATTTTAVGTVLDGVNVTGAGAYILASDVTIRDSSFARGSGDGIHVRSAQRATIVDTSVTGFGGDCVQIMGGAGHTVRGNALHDCAATGVIVNAGAQDVLIEGNTVTGTVAVALDARDAVRATIRGNELLAGSTRLGEGNVAVANTVGFLGGCSAPMTDSVVISWNTGLCVTPAALATGGNTSPALPQARKEEAVATATSPVARVAPVESTTLPDASSAPTLAAAETIEPAPEAAQENTSTTVSGATEPAADAEVTESGL